MSRRVRRVLASYLIALCVPLATFAQSNESDLAGEIRVLRAELAELRTRVTQLEAALARRPDELESLGVGGAGAGASAGRIAYVDRVQTVEPKPDPADTQRIATLEQEITQLEQTIAQVGAQAAQSTARVPQATTTEDTGQRELEVRQQQAQINAERRAHGTTLARYEQQRARKAAELQRLRRRATEPRQIIHGHRGDVLITLETEGDVLGNAQLTPAWRVITWEGRLISGDAESQHWVVERIEPANPSTAPAEDLGAAPPATGGGVNP